MEKNGLNQELLMEKKEKNLLAVLDDTIVEKGQLLIFVNSRKSSQKESERIIKIFVKKTGK